MFLFPPTTRRIKAITGITNAGPDFFPPVNFDLCCHFFSPALRFHHVGCAVWDTSCSLHKGSFNAACPCGAGHGLPLRRWAWHVDMETQQLRSIRWAKISKRSSQGAQPAFSQKMHSPRPVSQKTVGQFSWRRSSRRQFGAQKRYHSPMQRWVDKNVSMDHFLKPKTIAREFGKEKPCRTRRPNALLIRNQSYSDIGRTKQMHSQLLGTCSEI